MTDRPMPTRPNPAHVENQDDPVIAFLGKLFAYAAVFVVGSIGVLLASVVIGLAVRIFLAVAGVTP